jgi:hypothetical protein
MSISSEFLHRSKVTYFCRWAKISAELENRTDNDVKNRWHSHKRSADKYRRRQEAFDNVTREQGRSPGFVYLFDTDCAAPVEAQVAPYSQDLRRISEGLFDETGFQVELNYTGQSNNISSTPPIQYRAKYHESTLFDETMMDRGLYGFTAYAGSELPSSKSSMSGIPSETKADYVEAFDSIAFPTPRRPTDLFHPQNLKQMTADEWVNQQNAPLTTFTPTRFESFSSAEHAVALFTFKPQADNNGFIHAAFSPMYGLESICNSEIVEN